MTAPVVDTWVAGPSTPVDEGCLSTRERSRAAAMRAPAARARHRRSRAVLRHVLATELDASPVAVPLVAAPGAAPWVDADPAPAVGLAHAAGRVAVAVTDAGPVGIDVEVAGVRQRPVPFAVATATRRAAVRGLVPRPLEPVAVWVLLEAALKAAGTGFAQPQQEVTIARTGGGFRLDLPVGGPHAAVVEWLAGDVLVAVATAGLAPPRLRWQQMVPTSAPL